MPAVLPPLLIAQTETIAEEISDPQHVRVEDVARLWRVYALNRAHTGHDEATRLENFFWRIWSNREIVRSIRGDTLARLFMAISDGTDRVRASSVKWPVATTTVQSSKSPLSPDQQGETRREWPDEDEELDGSPRTEKAGGSPMGARGTCQKLPPILKKAGAGSSDLPSSTVFSASGAQGRISNSSMTRHGSSQNTEPLPPWPTLAEPGLKTVGRKKKGSVSTPGTKKARPSLPRKKSSQHPSTEQKRASQTSPRLPSGKTSPQDVSDLPATSSWQDVDSQPSSRGSDGSPFPAQQQPSSWLVDKNFRGRFVENQKRAASSVNLAGLGKSQSVRFLDEMPEQEQARRQSQARVDGDGDRQVSEKVDSTDDGPSAAAAAAASSAIDEENEQDEDGQDEDGQDEDEQDEEGGDMLVLPRTKSQLSVMIDKERKYSGSASLGPGPLRPDSRSGNSSVAQEEDDDEHENELLVMARRGKRGSTKDPDQPFKAAVRQGLLKGGGRGGGGEDGGGGTGHGPRSPPPLF